MAIWQPKKLRPRHSEIIRLSHSGLNNRQIAETVGITDIAVGLILRSPLAQAELARLKHAADLKTIDTPVRVRAALELDQAALDSLKFNHELVKNELVDKKLRARVATHFLDRVVFDKNPVGENENSYREILRSLNEIERQMHARPVTVIDMENRESIPEQPNDEETEAETEALTLNDVEFVKLNKNKI